MKLSKLIQELVEQLGDHGDVEVFIDGSSDIYLDPLPWYYDGGGDVHVSPGVWKSTRFNPDLCGGTILHLSSNTFDYGLDGECTYDGVKFEKIDTGDGFEDRYEQARQKFRIECRKL